MHLSKHPALLLATLLASSSAIAQVAIPPHQSVYNGLSRGYNFTANTSFYLVKLELPLDAYQTGDTAGFLVRINGAVALYSAGHPGPSIATQVLISTGDVVDVIGNWSSQPAGYFTAHNSYSPSGAFVTTIEGVAHTLQRTGWQWDIGDDNWNPNGTTGAYLAPSSTQMGRVIMYTAPVVGGTLATAASVGAGCIRETASLYEFFATPAAFDLANTSLTFNAVGGGYLATAGGTYQPVGSLSTPVQLMLANDAQVVAGTLGITVSSNAWVAFGAGNSNAGTPSVGTFLTNPARAFYSWHNLNPAAAGSGPVMYEEAGPLARVTFDGVYDSAGTSPASANFIQFQIDTATNTVTLCWGAMSGAGTAHLVGYSAGGPIVNAGDSDLSSVAAGLTTMSVSAGDRLPLLLTNTSRPLLGGSWDLTVSRIPASTVFGVHILSLSDPGILDLAFLGMPTCQLRANLDLIVGPWAPAAGQFDYSVPVPAGPPALLGFALFSQAAAFELPPVNAFGAVTSNGAAATLGNL